MAPDQDDWTFPFESLSLDERCWGLRSKRAPESSSHREADIIQVFPARPRLQCLKREPPQDYIWANLDRSPTGNQECPSKEPSRVSSVYPKVKEAFGQMASSNPLPRKEWCGKLDPCSNSMVFSSFTSTLTHATTFHRPFKR